MTLERIRRILRNNNVLKFSERHPDTLSRRTLARILSAEANPKRETLILVTAALKADAERGLIEL